MKRVLLPITTDLQQRYSQIHQQLNAGSKEKLAKPLGEILADLSCEVLDRMFGDLIAKAKGLAKNEHDLQTIADSEKVVKQVVDTFRKYMPYAVSLFGNERLKPVANYLKGQMIEKDSKFYLVFNVKEDLLTKTIQAAQKVKAGEQKQIPVAFDGLIKIIDLGVDVLIREPKRILDFNFVIDKTLTGVLNVTTSLGYKRLEKLATQMDTVTAALYVDHFIDFVEN